MIERAQRAVRAELSEAAANRPLKGSLSAPQRAANGAAALATPSHVRSLQRLLMFLVALWAGFVGAQTSAEAQAGDAVTWASGGGALPDPPEGYESREAEGVRWVFPVGAERDYETLRDLRAGAWETLEEDLGVDVGDALEVRIARNPDEMRELGPPAAPPPAYAAGVAYGSTGLILLTLSAPDTWERPDIETIFVHELSHIALRRAVQGHELPRWFVEGVAIHQSGERSLERVKALWGGHFGDRLIPLRDLDQRFPSKPHEVNLAYAQAADVVRYLRRDAREGRRFQTLIDELAEGETFAKALSDAYAVTEGQLERDWLASVGERARALPLIAGGGTFWVIAAFLLIAAWRRRRQQSKKRLAAMATEELRNQELIASLEALAEAKLRDLATTDEESFLVYMKRTPAPREADVPTVEHDGRRHTLH